MADDKKDDNEGGERVAARSMNVERLRRAWAALNAEAQVDVTMQGPRGVRLKMGRRTDAAWFEMDAAIAAMACTDGFLASAGEARYNRNGHCSGCDAARDEPHRDFCVYLYTPPMSAGPARDKNTSTPMGTIHQYAKNDLHVSVVVRHGRPETSTQIHARGHSSRDPLPYLRRAVAAIQAEIDGYSHCPMHRAVTQGTGPDAAGTPWRSVLFGNDTHQFTCEQVRAAVADAERESAEPREWACKKCWRPWPEHRNEPQGPHQSRLVCPKDDDPDFIARAMAIVDRILDGTYPKPPPDPEGDAELQDAIDAALEVERTLCIPRGHHGARDEEGCCGDCGAFFTPTAPRPPNH